MKNINTWLGKKVDYEKYKDPKIKKGFFKDQTLFPGAKGRSSV